MKRKIAAILAADAAEYSRLVAQDEDQALRQLVASVEVFKASVETHGGRIFNTAGDAVLAEFQSAVEAVRSAIDIQERLSVRNEAYAPERRMMFRMGISIGDVVENGGDLLGDGVNIAARLQTLSQPGGLAISRWVQEQVAGKVPKEFRDTGYQVVKNMPAPIHVFQFSPPGPAKPPKLAKQPKPPKPPKPPKSTEPKVRWTVSPEAMDRIRGIFALAAGVGFLAAVIFFFVLNRPQLAPVAIREAPPSSAKLESPTPPPPVAAERLPYQPASRPKQSPASPEFISPEQSLTPKEEKAYVAPSAPAEAALPPSNVLPKPAQPAREEPRQAVAPSGPPTEAAVPPKPAAGNGNTGVAQGERPPESAAPSSVPVLARDAATDHKQKKRQCDEILDRGRLGELTPADTAYLRSNRC